MTDGDTKEPEWYEVVRGSTLEQGDILTRCPVPVIQSTLEVGEGGEISAEIEKHDVCVLTQSCDLLNKKAKTVLLGAVVAWPKVVETAPSDLAFHKEKGRRKVQQGAILNFCLLHRRRLEPRMQWSVVDFRTLFTLPPALVEAHAERQGQRLRLKPPYKEHLAQAFARFHMRVGLPHDARTFITDPGD